MCNRLGLTVQKLLTNKLKTLKMTTSIVALNFALKPTTTITHATKPKMATMTLQTLHDPLKMKPMKRKISKTRPASWKYILRSFSSICGRPAKALFFRTHESDKTIRSPPMTERFRRKKFKSKMSPYPRACVMTTPIRPPTAKSEYLRAITRVEQILIAMTLIIRKRWVRTRGTAKLAYQLWLQFRSWSRTVSVVMEE